MNELIGTVALLAVSGIIAAVIMGSAWPAAGVLTAACLATYALISKK